MNKIIKFVFVLSNGLFLTSCSFLTDISLHGDKAQERYWKNYSRKVEQKKESVEGLIGQSTEVLNSEMGAPSIILYHSALHGTFYDEKWIYHREKGIPLVNSTSYSIDFYVQDSIVKAVDISGLPFD